MKRLGLVGAGPWARRYVETVARREDVRFTAVARRSGGRVPELPDARAHEHWQELIELCGAGELDGVVVATTPSHQAEVAAAAVARGAALLCEKPLGARADDARRVLEAVEHAPRPAPLVVDFVHLWAPAYVALKRLVAESSSRPAAIRGIGCNHGPFRAWSALHDWGSHDVALCLDLLGPEAPLEVLEASVLPGPSGAGELHRVHLRSLDVEVRLELGNGATAKARSFAVTLADGRTLVYDDVKPHAEKLRDGAAAVALLPAMPLALVVDAFLEQIERAARGELARSEPLAAARLALRVAQTLDAVAALERDSRAA